MQQSSNQNPQPLQRRPLSFIGAGAGADPMTQADQAHEAGRQLFAQGHFEASVAQFDRALRLRPDNIQSLVGFAEASLRAGCFDVVEPTLNRALQLDSDCVAAHEMLSQWCLLKGRPAEAKLHIAKAVSLAPNDPWIAISLAAVHAGTGDPYGAWRIIEPLQHQDPVKERVAIVYAQIGRSIGRATEAAEYGLQHLRSTRARPPERRRLLFELAGLLDHLGRYNEAFNLAREARELAATQYDPAAHSRDIDATIANFSDKRLSALPRASEETDRLVFIVGMPRSGTSLVEQILACHPDVYAAGELEDLIHLVGDAKRDGAIDVNQMQRRYLDTVDSLNGTSKRFTDKNPLNYENLGWIELLFPGARIIHCTREPLDVCVSCLMTDIAAGLTFCQTQERLAAYYNDYARLMDHWRSVLKTPMLEVSYEAVVSDLEAEARKIVAFLDLPWDPKCLEFHANRRGVGSASRDQVRQPIYKSSIGRWKHYERNIQALRSSLSPCR